MGHTRPDAIRTQPCRPSRAIRQKSNNPRSRVCPRRRSCPQCIRGLARGPRYWPRKTHASKPAAEGILELRAIGVSPGQTRSRRTNACHGSSNLPSTRNAIPGHKTRYTYVRLAVANSAHSPTGFGRDGPWTEPVLAPQSTCLQRPCRCPSFMTAGPCKTSRTQ